MACVSPDRSPSPRLWARSHRNLGSANLVSQGSIATCRINCKDYRERVTASGSLRERKKNQTRAEIFAAAIELFRSRGYEQTTIDQIVEAANYSRAAFNRHFGSKEDVLFGDADQR